MIEWLNKPSTALPGVMEFREHSKAVSSVAVSPDGKRMASFSGDKTVKVTELDSGRVKWTLSGHSADVNSVAWSPDGTKLASGSADETVRIWEAATGKQLWQLRGHSGPVTAVTFASEGIVASSSTSCSTKFWDLGTGQETEKTAEAVTEGFTFPKEGGARERRINSYVVAAKGQTLVIHKAPEDKAPEDKVETAADGKAGTETPVAFFQCEEK